MKSLFKLAGHFALSMIILITLSCCFDAYSQFTNTGQEAEIPDFADLPTIKWKFKTTLPIYSSPVVCENMVYIGGLDSVLYAVDINSGKATWTFHTNGEIRSNACISNSLLFLNGGDGSLYALDKKTGKISWEFKTIKERKYDFADYFHSTPLLNNGILYFGSGDGYFYAVNAGTGELVWKFETGNIVHTTPAISNNRVFFGSFDGYVYALDITNGELAWKFKTVGHRYFPAGEVQGSPFAYNNLVFIGARDYNIYALDQEEGYCHWNKAFSKGWGLNNNVHDSVLYISSADERVLVSTDPETGKEYWKKNMEFLVFGNNAYSKTMLYLGTTIGKLYAINLKTGEDSWSFETQSYLDNRAKYFKPDNSNRDDIYSIIKSSEQFLEVECELGGIFSTPWISADFIIFSSTNGTLYCLER